MYLNKPFLLLLICLLPARIYAQGTANYNKWVLKGFELYNAGQYKASAQAYMAAFRSVGGSATADDRYNAACSWSMAGVKDSAFAQLDLLTTRDNFTDADHMAIDTDLKSLHGDKRWDNICATARQNKERAAALLDKSLVAQLETIYRDDQQYRLQYDSLVAQKGNASKEVADLWKKINRYDSINLIKVVAILDKHGWPGPEVAGEDGSTTVFLVIQHADLKTQDKYLPMMRDAVKKGKAEAASLAMLEDRVALGHHRKQTYGTQVFTDAGGSFLSPLADPDNVDKRRASVRLGPIAEYLQNFGMKWNLAEYKKQLPELEKRQKNIN